MAEILVLLACMQDASIVLQWHEVCCCTSLRLLTIHGNIPSASWALHGHLAWTPCTPLTPTDTLQNSSCMGMPCTFTLNFPKSYA